MSVHLHVRSSYTLLNSTLRIHDIVALAKQHGYSSVALCDKHVMHGAMAFHHECEKQGIHAIYGMECECIHEDLPLSFLLLAKDDQGYQDLLALSTRYKTDRTPLTFMQLCTYSYHCITLSAGDNDALQSAVIKEDIEQIK